ncbi:ScyD/ScyE family protein [Streptodolium elevatio]
MRRSTPVLGAVVAALALGMSAIPATAHEDGVEPSVDVVVTGLNNPRQLSTDWHNWSIYVAEAGRGAESPDQCGEFGCIGRTGSVTWIKSPAKTTNSVTPKRVVVGLPSNASPDGAFAVGPNGVDAVQGKLWTVVGGGEQEIPGGYKEAGKLLSVQTHGANPKVVADIEKYELDHNPGGNPEDVHSNPYAVLALNDRQIVADAGANTVYEVRNGRIKVLAVLPGGPGGEGGANGPQQVPSSVTRGPDGDYYVGVLAEGDGPGGAKVYRIGAGGGVKGTIDGFTGVHGLTFNHDGDLYVSELFGGEQGSGRVVKVDADSGARTYLDVPFPAGLAVDRAGTVYVAAWSISDADGFSDPESGMTGEPGQVWRLNDF